MAKEPTQDVFALLEQIEGMKQPAIDALLAEREEIDRKLAILGHQDKSAPVARKPVAVDGEKPKRQMSPETIAKMKESQRKRREKAAAEA